MTGIKEKSLSEALSHCMLSELPEKEDGKNYWTRAIALVMKRDSSQSYVYAEMNPDTLEPEVKIDFGRMVQTVEVLEYYPFCYLSSEFIPQFKEKNLESRISYVNTYLPNLDCSKMKLKDLDREILKIAVREQLAQEKNKKYE